MSGIELPGDVRVALSHTAAYGLAAIIEDAGVPGVTVAWTPSLDARAVVDAPGLGPDAVARHVLGHAQRHAAVGSWTAATAGIAGTTAGRLSPRVKVPADDHEWLELERLRHETVDELAADHRWLDLALIGALGEPAYWRFDAQANRRPDEGASRWEMKTRNRGEDFVQHRLHRLAVSVAARDPAKVRDGLAGSILEDEVGRNEPGSRTGTGLARLGPVDNALAWCSLWGLSLLPVVPRTERASETAGHGSVRLRGAPRQAWFHLPIPGRPVTLARLATILASEQLATVAAADAISAGNGGLGARAGREWLVDRGVGGLVRFPIGVFGSSSAPERRTLLGSVVRLAP
jgi:CRISPR-associated protein Csb3